MRTIEMTNEEIQWIENKRNGGSQYVLGYFPKKTWGNPSKEKFYIENGYRCNADVDFYLRNEMDIFEGRVNKYSPTKTKFSQEYLEKIKKAFIAFSKKRGYNPSFKIYNHTMEEWLLKLFPNEWEILKISVQREGRCSNTVILEETPEGVQTRTIYYGWRDRYDQGPYISKGWIGMLDFAYDSIYSSQNICYYKLRNIRTKEVIEIGSDIGSLL